MIGILALCLFGVDGGILTNRDQTQSPQHAHHMAHHADCMGQQFNGPMNSELPREEWLQEIRAERIKFLRDTNFDDSAYNDPRLTFAQKAWIQPQMMMHDRFFYDPILRQYTVDRYLDDLEQRYGGIDQVLIWTPYTNLGCDDRNQFDMIRDLPGGFEGIRNAVQRFNERNVSVIFTYVPWDTGTRREPEDKCLWNNVMCPTNPPNPECIQTGVALAACMPKSDTEVFARILKEIDVPGINGDTMDHMPEEFYTAGLDDDFPLTIAPEIFPADLGPELSWMTMSWGYWGTASEEPCVSVPKWLYAKHMVQVNNRWAKDRTPELQQAWVNGAGYETWENVWGIWNQVTQRDGAVIKSMGHIMRNKFKPEDDVSILINLDWEPAYPTLVDGTYAAIFPRDTDVIYTLINKNDFDVDANIIQVANTNFVYADCWNGEILNLGRGNSIQIKMERNGYGCVYGSTAFSQENFDFFLTMSAINQIPLGQLDAVWRPLTQIMIPIDPAPLADQDLDGKVLIPSTQYRFQVEGVEIEGREEIPEGYDVQFPWENQPSATHDVVLSISPFYIDKFPITNAQFKKFLDESAYTPEEPRNFLRHWGWPEETTFPKGDGNKPVVWICKEDARAYATFYGARLPNDWEWQYAGQGLDNRTFPWGNDFENGVRVPEFIEDNTNPGPVEVGQHLDGCSTFGVCDLTGLVWQFTNEFHDSHTRTIMTRGGANYRPLYPDPNFFQPGGWYYPDIKRLDQHGKFLLMHEGTDRAGTFGFRTVIDAPRLDEDASTLSPAGYVIGLLVLGLIVLGVVTSVIYGRHVAKKREISQNVPQEFVPLRASTDQTDLQ